ncbi:hypothetical protein HU200_054915 [Digitaria exilis]|uniref:Uncharacterized protein n=1 Tax=Digitaria exilis TaxID=1010633 RepID=A0A835AGN8_9POAL|nr:hypothetical protein HU200_054915 [Digitaria exilis]
MSWLDAELALKPDLTTLSPVLSSSRSSYRLPDVVVSEDEKKTALLRALPGAAERLVLFQADMHDAATFEPAIAGCEFVFLVAAPMTQDISAGRSKVQAPSPPCMHLARLYGVIWKRKCAYGHTVFSSSLHGYAVCCTSS